MMMVDNVVALLRPQHDWYHVMADERADLLRLLLSQAFAFFLDLAHADSDLGGTQAFDRDRLQNRLARVSHGFLPAIASLASNHHRSSRSTRHKYSSSGPRIAAKAPPHARSIAVDGESAIRSLPNLSFDFATVLRNGDAPVGFVRTHTSWAGCRTTPQAALMRSYERRSPSRQRPDRRLGTPSTGT